MEPTVTREVTVDAAPEEVWSAIADEEARAAWLGEDGADRVVEVDDRVDGERITWTWWPPDDGPASGSTVTITLLPHDDGTTGVRVVERPVPGAIALAQAGAPEAWSRRLLELELWLLLALARV